MKIIETHPREKGFVSWGHCQNILDDPRKTMNQQLQNRLTMYSSLSHVCVYGGLRYNLLAPNLHLDSDVLISTISARGKRFIGKRFMPLTVRTNKVRCALV